MKIWILGFAIGMATICGAEIRVSEMEHHGQAAWEIKTAAATYVFQQTAGGFSSIYDQDGNDWISFKPTGGSDGKYRGIPNLVYPEGFFHPGNTNCISRIETNAVDRITIYTECDSGQWACQWDISPVSATLTVLKVPKTYWFLYEGTPGGKLDESSDWMVRSDGARLMASESWKIDAQIPRWVVFGDGETGRALLLACDGTEAVADSYWPMQHNMTVFGFGRNKLESQLHKTPTVFTVALLNPADAVPDRLTATVESIIQHHYCPVKSD
jgi:hypothetical protein